MAVSQRTLKRLIGSLTDKKAAQELVDAIQEATELPVSGGGGGSGVSTTVKAFWKPADEGESDTVFLKDAEGNEVILPANVMITDAWFYSSTSLNNPNDTENVIVLLSEDGFKSIGPAADLINMNTNPFRGTTTPKLGDISTWVKVENETRLNLQFTQNGIFPTTGLWEAVITYVQLGE